ncbi:MAG TPA: neocarzinostatin apoprotein domain-containing protein, partial [Acidimicrobiales bacterium]|nr:neocarzinostatin apoprotein domain-containing protein [Acidimicrobiales bacterium]
MTVTVTPDAGLLDGEAVTVTVSGATPGAGLFAAQCLAGVSPSGRGGGCLYNDSASAPADATGSATLTLRVDARFVDDVTGQVVDCRVPGTCAVTVSDEFLNEVGAPLVFAPDAPLAPPPVMTVSPADDLVDRQAVTVDVTGMVWSDWARLVQCAAGTVEPGGCDNETTAYVDVADGAFTAELPVSAVIDTWTMGAVDCRVPGSCVLVATSDFGQTPEKAAVAPLAFDPGTVVSPGSITLDPSADLVDGQEVTVTGSGFTPGWVSLHVCGPEPSSESCAWTGGEAEVGADGAFSAPVRLTAVVAGPSGDLDCRTAQPRCLLVATGGAVTSPRAGRAELAFRVDGPLRPGPSVRVDPSTDLGDPALVTVTATGVSPNSSATIVVCAAGQPALCDPETYAFAYPDSDGTLGPVDLGVAAQFTAEGGGTVDCRAAPGCEVVVREGAGGRRGTAALAFAPATGDEERYRDPVFDEVTVTRDVVYGTAADAAGTTVPLSLDIYEPAGDTAAQRPVVAWLHGGWFGGDDREAMASYAEDLARKGYVAVSVGYRQRPGLHCCPSDDAAAITAALLDVHDDAAAAVRWLQEHAADHRIDPRAIAVGGVEAGGSG